MKNVNFEKIFFILINLCFTYLGAFLLYSLVEYLCNITPNPLETYDDLGIAFIAIGFTCLFTN